MGEDIHLPLEEDVDETNVPDHTWRAMRLVVGFVRDTNAYPTHCDPYCDRYTHSNYCDNYKHPHAVAFTL